MKDIFSHEIQSLSIPQVKILNLINPSNPLGVVIDDTPENREYYRQIYNLAEKYNFMIFDDLVYWGTEHDTNKRAMPFLTAVPEAKNRVIMAFGPSKAIGSARIRTGILVAPEWFILEIRKVILNTNSGISAFNQYAMASAFDMNFELERELFLSDNAIEYALRRDVCIVGLLGETKVLSDFKKYNIDYQRLFKIKKFIQLSKYAEILLSEYNNNQGLLYENLNKVNELLDSLEKSIKQKLTENALYINQSVEIQEQILRHQLSEELEMIDIPDEIYLIYYIFYRELKYHSHLTLPPILLSKLSNTYNDHVENIIIPLHYQLKFQKYLERFLLGTKYLDIYSIPQATFFLTVNASKLIGKHMPFNIKTTGLNQRKILDAGQQVLSGENFIHKLMENPLSTAITSSYDIDLLLSWCTQHNYLIGELMNVSPERGLLRMTYAEPPIIICKALDSLRDIEKYVFEDVVSIV